MEYSKDLSVILYLNTVDEETLLTVKSLYNQSNLNYEIIVIGEFESTNEEVYQTFNDLLNEKSYLVRYFEQNNKREANCLNFGIQQASGKYIMVAKNHSIYNDNVLADQVKYMNLHNIDMLISSYNNIDNGCYYLDNITQLMVDNPYMIETAIMSHEKLSSLEYIFEPYWEGSYFHRFLIHVIQENLLKIYCNNISIVTVGNRPEKEKFNNKIDFIRNVYANKEKDDQLTIILPFKNEGYEVERTVYSILATTKKRVSILLVNDTSDDGYNYKWIAQTYKCIYHENKVNLGVAGSRDKAIFDLVQTPFFMILDAHMRFYDLYWDDIMIPIIQKYPNDILCSSTIEMTKDKTFYYNEDGYDKIRGTIGAYLNDRPYWSCGWQNKDFWDNIHLMVEIPVVLGACYMSSVEHWKKIGGLKFLKKYGLDEQLMSIKNYMYGSKNIYITNFYTGHFYKVNEGQNKLGPVNNEITYNNLMMTYLFTPENIDNHIQKVKNEQGENADKIIQMFKDDSVAIDEYRAKLKAECKRTFDDFMKFNDEIRYYQNGQTVFIIGCWTGIDVDYYLYRGYKVIAVEANARLYHDLRMKYKVAIQKGNLVLINKAVYSEEGQLIPFYIEPNNPNWSSIYQHVAQRLISDPDDILKVYVETTTIPELISQYGEPDLLRISLSGGELEVLEGIKKMDYLPKYLTTETEFVGNAYHEGEEFEILDKLHELGYTKFHLFENHNFYEYGTLLDKNKYKWLDYDQMRLVIQIDRDNFFKRNPNFMWYQYYNSLHCTY